MHTARNSVGYDLDADLFEALDDRLADLPTASRRRIADRLDRHRTAMADRDGGYEADYYDFRVVTKRERRIRPYVVESVTERSPTDGRRYVLDHAPADEINGTPDEE
jgi:hypothetical protein